MDKRKGRFVLSKKTMRVGTEIYKKIVDQMLLVHIAHMERKMRACIQCAPRCAPAGGRLIKRPYTRPYKDKQWVPRSHVPSYLLKQLVLNEKTRNKVLSREDERRIRRRYFGLEGDLRDAHGNLDDAEAAANERNALLDAQLAGLAGSIVRGNYLTEPSMGIFGGRVGPIAGTPRGAYGARTRSMLDRPAGYEPAASSPSFVSRPTPRRPTDPRLQDEPRRVDWGDQRVPEWDDPRLPADPRLIDFGDPWRPGDLTDDQRDAQVQRMIQAGDQRDKELDRGREVPEENITEPTTEVQITASTGRPVYVVSTPKVPATPMGGRGAVEPGTEPPTPAPKPGRAAGTPVAPLILPAGAALASIGDGTANPGVSTDDPELPGEDITKDSPRSEEDEGGLSEDSFIDDGPTTAGGEEYGPDFVMKNFTEEQTNYLSTHLEKGDEWWKWTKWHTDAQTQKEWDREGLPVDTWKEIADLFDKMDTHNTGGGSAKTGTQYALRQGSGLVSQKKPKKGPNVGETVFWEVPDSFPGHLPDRSVPVTVFEIDKLWGPIWKNPNLLEYSLGIKPHVGVVTGPHVKSIRLRKFVVPTDQLRPPGKYDDNPANWVDLNTDWENPSPSDLEDTPPGSPGPPMSPGLLPGEGADCPIGGFQNCLVDDMPAPGDMPAPKPTGSAAAKEKPPTPAKPPPPASGPPAPTPAAPAPTSRYRTDSPTPSPEPETDPEDEWKPGDESEAPSVSGETPRLRPMKSKQIDDLILGGKQADETAKRSAELRAARRKTE